MTNRISPLLTNDEKRAHLTDLKREHLIPEGYIQEICRPTKRKKCRLNPVAFLQLPPQMSWRCAKKREVPTRMRVRFGRSGTLPRHSVFARCAAAISAIAAHLPDKHFVIRIDGRVKSHHRRFLDALREGLQLRDQFPQHDVKVQSMQASGERNSLH